MSRAVSPLKPVTVRLPEDDLKRLKNEADELGVSLGVLLRILVRQTLRGTSGLGRLQRAQALRDAGAHFAEQAAVQSYTEEDAVALSRAARKRLAEQRTR